MQLSAMADVSFVILETLEKVFVSSFNFGVYHMYHSNISAG